MTQKNIDVMDIIVSKMVEGDKLSKALKKVYDLRNVCIPYSDEDLKTSIVALKMSNRSTNALIRAKLKTIGEVVEYCENHKITEITNLGVGSGVEIFETILDYCWNRMTQKEKVAFLIDTVERNSDNIREGIA